MRKITYTFPANAPIAAVAGVTFTGGIVDGPVVRFAAPLINGQRVAAKIEGKPELAAAVAAASLPLCEGEADYRKAANAYANAVYAYDAADDMDFAKRIAADKAYEALEVVYAQFPATKLLNEVIAYSKADHWAKMNAGNVALSAIENGTSVSDAHAKMVADWTAHAIANVD